MSNSYANYINLRSPETSKSDDTSDEANRRREMRRKQQSSAIKFQNHDRIASKNLLDEVLGKEFVQSKSKSLSNQPDTGRHQGLPVPAQLKERDAKNESGSLNKLADSNDHSNLDESHEFVENCDRSKHEGIDNFNQSNDTSEVNEALELTLQSKEHNETTAEKEQQSALSNRKFSPLPLSMVNTQLDKLKNHILSIDKNLLQEGMNPENLQELAAEQTRMAISLDFLEGYAEGIVKDEAARHQFEQSCNDLRERVVQSEQNFNLALASLAVNQPKQLLIQSQALPQKIAEINDLMTPSNKREISERARLSEESSVIQHHEGKQKDSRLDEMNAAQRVRVAKRDRANAEETLPLLVQRSV